MIKESIKSVTVSQAHYRSDKDRNELDLQDGDKASVSSYSPSETGDNATAATQEAAVEVHEDSSESGSRWAPH